MRQVKKESRANVLSVLCLKLALAVTFSCAVLACFASTITPYPGNTDVWSINEDVRYRGNCTGGGCSPTHNCQVFVKPVWMTGGTGNNSAYSTYTAGSLGEPDTDCIKAKCPNDASHWTSSDYWFKIVDVEKFQIDDQETQPSATVYVPVGSESFNIQAVLTPPTTTGLRADFMTWGVTGGTLQMSSTSDQLIRTVPNTELGDISFTCKAGNGTLQSASAYVVGIDHVEYKVGSGSYQPVPDPFFLPAGTVVTFKAFPTAAQWPPNQPVWSVTGSGVTQSPSGPYNTVTFNSSGTVTATCGSSQSTSNSTSYYATLLCRRKGNHPVGFDVSANLAAGGIATEVHEAELKVIMDPPAPNITFTLDTDSTIESYGYATRYGKNYRPLLKHGILTTGADGTATDTDAYRSGDVYEFIHVNLLSPVDTDTVLDTCYMHQLWDNSWDYPLGGNSTNLQGPSLVMADTPGIFTYHICLDGGEGAWPGIDGHQISFATSLVIGSKWQDTEYVPWAAYNSDTDVYSLEEIQDRYPGYVIESFQGTSCQYADLSVCTATTDSTGNAYVTVTPKSSPSALWLIDEIEMRARDGSTWYAADTDSPVKNIPPAYRMTDVGNAKLKSVTFSGDRRHEVCFDTDSDSYYTAPQWLDNNFDWDAVDPEEHMFPVCYDSAADATMKAQVAVDVEGATTSFPAFRLKAEGTDGYNFVPTTDGTFDSNSKELSFSAPVDCSKAFDTNKVDYINPLVLDWSISYDSGTTWHRFGQSLNEVFVTRQAPQCANPFRTVLYLACKNPGGTDTDSCIANTWQSFSSGNGPANVQAWNDNSNSYDRNLYYYYTANGLLNTTAADLLIFQEGQCHAWADLFKECLKANNVANVKQTRITSGPSDYSQFGVKNLSFATEEFPLAAPWKYSEEDLHAQTTLGVAGQNMQIPQDKTFERHFIVHDTDAVYHDPSYGKTYLGPDDFRNNAVAAWEKDFSGVAHWRQCTGDTDSATVTFTDLDFP